ncbi:unnamed protein product, partial [Allacma fusca]
TYRSITPPASPSPTFGQTTVDLPECRVVYDYDHKPDDCIQPLEKKTKQSQEDDLTNLKKPSPDFSDPATIDKTPDPVDGNLLRVNVSDSGTNITSSSPTTSSTTAPPKKAVSLLTTSG